VAIHIQNRTVARLATELAALTGESKTEAIRKSLEERMFRLSNASLLRARRAELARVLGRDIRAMVPAGGRRVILSQEEVQELLAYGP
jgi:antitoxin VapB